MIVALLEMTLASSSDRMVIVYWAGLSQITSHGKKIEIRPSR